MTRERTRLPTVNHHNQRLHIEYLAPDELIIPENNPRQHSKKQIEKIAASISVFGFVVPVLIDENCIVQSGVARVLAAKTLKLHEIPIIRLSHLTEEQQRAFRIADNRLAELSEWNEKILAEELKFLSALDLEFDLEIIGFDIGEIDFRIQELEHNEESDADDIIPPLAESAVTQFGDVWTLGRHRIICGNALEENSFKRLLVEISAHAAIVDMPYNVPIVGNVSGLGSKTHRDFAMACGELSSDEFIRFVSTALTLLAQYTMAGSLHYCFMDWRHIREALAAGTEAYEKLINLCVWTKTNAGMGSLYRSQHELVLVFRKAGAQHLNNVQLGKYGRHRSNVWNYPGMNSFNRHTEEGNLLDLHPTVKPVKLLADAILDCTKRGEIVLDSFLGSGSTLIAAEKVGRRCYGIELDPLYVDTTIRRWEAHTGDKARHSRLQQTFDEVARARGALDAG